jgi:hypothetical protein
MTICFHVDDCKLSHRTPKVMDKMITWLRQEYESIFEDGSGEMTVSRGKVHTYRNDVGLHSLWSSEDHNDWLCQ